MSFFLLILSVLLGASIVFFLKPKDATVRLFLAFSGAYLLAITILHLLPETYQNTSSYTKTGILILVGVLVQSILESFSGGAEHGHIHTHTSQNNFPWLLYISLCLHAFTEGLPIHHDTNNLLWAIVVHKVPIAIVLTTFLIQANYSKKNIFSALIVFSLMSPIGILVSNKLPFFIKYKTEITALIIGAFLHISTIILFESSKNHAFNHKKFIAILLGMLLSILTVL
ncbi:ZIP family metal transporter [Tenacibaculum sp. UWU-22]|uniref:ZIP family metal transporter n=1 Tax=Tenacibaculum sp. UWU-22 TaxID=3234187 RepID=UPI0034DAFFEF